MARRKSYNPFKMWGSYVGLAVGVIVVVLLGGALVAACAWGECKDSIFFWVWLIPTLFGFFLGWGIHALARRISR